jgi:hypothetical protein
MDFWPWLRREPGPRSPPVPPVLTVGLQRSSTIGPEDTEGVALRSTSVDQNSRRLYRSSGFQSVRARYIEISRLLATTPPGPERSRLVKEMYELRG